MNPFVVLSAVISTAAAAPTSLIATPAAAHPLGYKAAIHAAPVAAAHVAAPVAAHVAVAAPVAAPVAVPVAPAVSVPAPYTTKEVQGPPAVSVHQPPSQVTKQVHYADQTFIAGYNTRVLKPAIPDFPIAVPTALKGTKQVTSPIVSVRKEPFVVNEPYAVDKPYQVPYDVVKNVEKVVEVPQAVHVQKPYLVPVPVPVRGEDIVKYTQTAPVVKHSHEHRVAPPIVERTGVTLAAAPAYAAVAPAAYAAVAPAAYAAAPAYSHAAVHKKY